MNKNIFKSLFMMAFTMTFLAVLNSCEIDECKIESSPRVDKSSLTFNLGDGAKEVRVYSQEDWGYIIDEDWVHAIREENSNKLIVQVDENRDKDIRECVLTVYSKKNERLNTTVKVEQYSSLVQVSCSESELNFRARAGATESVFLESNGDWKVRSTPEWLRASVSSGNGDKIVLFETLSANKSSVSRTGMIVIATCDEEVNIPVMQYGEAMSDCQVTPKNITILSNGIAFDMDYSHAGNVAHYYRGYMEASRAGLMTNPEIIWTLQHEFQRHLPSDDEVADFSNLKSNTKYIIYSLAYDKEGERGELISTEVTTCKEELNEPCGWIGDLKYTDCFWEWNVTKSATCYSYWMMTTENPEFAYASDVLQAWWLEEAIRCNMVTEYYNGGQWQQKRGGNMIAVWTRGQTANGTWAGVISWNAYDVSSSAPIMVQGTESASCQTMRKQCVSGDHSGRKLSRDQYRLFNIR